MTHETPQHISQINTLWTSVHQAHRAEGAVAAAQELLPRRYSPAILTRVALDPDPAAELFPKFAVRMLRGDFGGATARRGRFRDYLKTSLRHLAADVLPRAPADETGFDQAWRDELMGGAWRHLARLENDSGQPWLTVLRTRADRRGATSAELAEELAHRRGRAISEANLRKLLQRAREAFCDRLVAEVSGYVDSPERDAVEGELVDLGLHEWCKPALDRRFGPPRRGDEASFRKRKAFSAFFVTACRDSRNGRKAATLRRPPDSTFLGGASKVFR